VTDPKRADFDYAKTSGLTEIRLRLDLLTERLRANLVKVNSPRLLEIGVGTGDCTMMLAGRYENLTAVDIDPGICRTIGQRLRKAGRPAPKIICAPIEECRFDTLFDAIILQNILEHVADPVTMLRQLGKILTPNGRLYINVPLANSLHRLMGVELGMIARPDALSETDLAYGHCRVYSTDLMREHVESAQLRIDFEMPYYLKPFSTAMLQGLSDEQHAARFALGRKLPQFASYLYVEATPL
jgi:SAM-dependent methyltransferase